MTNWNHVKNDATRALLSGRIPADVPNLAQALDSMLEEQEVDASNFDLEDSVFFYRADMLSEAHDAYMSRDKGLCMNRIKTFYSV
jgi:hypothetical protein